GGPVRGRGLPGAPRGGAGPQGGGPGQRSRVRRRGVLARIAPAPWLAPGVISPALQEERLPHGKPVFRLEKLHQRPLHLPIPKPFSNIDFLLGEWVQASPVKCCGDDLLREYCIHGRINNGILLPILTKTPSQESPRETYPVREEMRTTS